MIAVSTNLDMTVAMAAPSTPSLGKPILPKMSSQLKVKLTATAAMPARMGTMVSPVSRRVPA